MKTVIAAVETGSFTKAAEKLGISTALVSKYIGEVEVKLGIRLFNRTTRQIALTESGQQYYNHAVSFLDLYAQMLDEIMHEQTLPRGNLKISAPVSFGENNLAPILPKFISQYPNLKLDLKLENRPFDILEENIDVRIIVGHVEDSSLVARKICRLPLVICASPSYLDNADEINTISDIKNHPCIADSNFSFALNWPLKSKNGKKESIAINSCISVNSPTAVARIAQSGGGIALVPKFIVQKALQSNQLIEILQDHIDIEFGLYAIFAHRRFLPKKIRYFIDFLIDEFQP